MRLSIIGTGYVGLVTGVGLADLGHNVVCIDIDKEKINKLKKGIMPIYEVGLKEIVDRNVKEGRLTFSTSIKEGIKDSEVVFIAVGTPQDEDGSADLQYVMKVAEDIGKDLNGYKVIVTKSTVPVGTSEKVKDTIIKQDAKAEFDVASNPEFLREGAAVKDFFTPDRIVIGVDNEKAKEVMKKVYAGIERTGKPILFTDIKSSEIIKYASNAMLATRISFVNMLSELCEKQGGDITQVSKGMGLDTRIGTRFLHAGIGYGGSCFPKDVKALIKTLKDNGCDNSILHSVDAVNSQQRKKFVDMITSNIDVKGKTIAIWGLAFKPKTDDMREAPSIDIIRSLMAKGAEIKAFDPVAEDNAKKIIEGIEYCSKPMEALEKADALVICTEWDEFRSIEFSDIKSRLSSPLIFDGRNIYDPILARKAGFRYLSIGR
ncbi:UDP-glucose/GDP-mannose dehydrogenase family protein [Candidatus Woesearchaeota archaeon]|nr:UDP-glucose/GDP-mannose dehydrogenase family protein [Candidatus Woesearchaeota archaeon]